MRKTLWEYRLGQNLSFITPKRADMKDNRPVKSMIKLKYPSTSSSGTEAIKIKGTANRRSVTAVYLTCKVISPE